MKFIISEKQHMTQLFDEKGRAYPATVLKAAAPVVITHVKRIDTDGYSAVQVGYGSRKEKHARKAQVGHAKGLGVFAGFKEFRNFGAPEAVDAFKHGDSVSVSSFEPGERVMISAVSKGKGFQGVVKRHGFAGGRRTHGQKHSEREPGSIGATGPQRVFKGTRMAGRMGTDRVTLKNVEILAIDPKEGVLVVKGSVPGRRGTIVEVMGK